MRKFQDILFLSPGHSGPKTSNFFFSFSQCNSEMLIRTYFNKIILVGNSLVSKLRQFFETSGVSFWANISYFFEKAKITLIFEFVMASSTVIFIFTNYSLLFKSITIWESLVRPLPNLIEI